MRDSSEVESAIKGRRRSPRRDGSRMARKVDQLGGAIKQSGQDGSNRLKQSLSRTHRSRGDIIAVGLGGYRGERVPLWAEVGRQA